MLSLTSVRKLLMLSTVGLAVLAPPLDSLARSRREPAVEAPPAPPAPPVGLSDRFVADAAAYQAYIERVSAVSPAFSSGAGVADGLRTSAAYEPRALIRGAVAYGAVAALASPTFVASVRAAATSEDNRRIILGYLVSDPNYATAFAGSDVAAGLAKEALMSSGARLVATGKVIKASAYSVQHQAWSKELVVDPSGRLAAVEAAASGGLTPASDHEATLRSAAAGGPALPITARAEDKPYGPLVLRALQLAAIAALGEAGDEAYGRLNAATPDADSEACLHMVRLNLNQCLAVAKPHYEDIFCMGQHAMTDTGACLVKSSIVEVAPPPTVHAPVVEKPKAKTHTPTKRRRRH